MDAPLHHSQRDAVDFADNHAAGVSGNGSLREVGDFTIRKHFGAGELVRKGTKSGAKDNCKRGSSPDACSDKVSRSRDFFKLRGHVSCRLPFSAVRNKAKAETDCRQSIHGVMMLHIWSNKRENATASRGPDLRISVHHVFTAIGA